MAPIPKQMYVISRFSAIIVKTKRQKAIRYAPPNKKDEAPTAPQQGPRITFNNV